MYKVLKFYYQTDKLNFPPLVMEIPFVIKYFFLSFCYYTNNTGYILRKGKNNQLKQYTGYKVKVCLLALPTLASNYIYLDIYHCIYIFPYK